MEDFATFCKNQPSLSSRIWTSFKTKPKALNKRDNLTKLESIVKQELQAPIDNKLVENNFHGTLFEPFVNKDNFWNFIFALGMVLGSITIGFVFSLILHGVYIFISPVLLHGVDIFIYPLILHGVYIFISPLILHKYMS